MELRTRVEGLNKSVSRMLFGTAMGPMLAGEDANDLLSFKVSGGNIKNAQ